MHLLLLGVLGLAGGCHQDSKPEPLPPLKPAAQRDHLVIGVPAEPRNLLPLLAETPADLAVADATSIAPMDGDFQCKLTWNPEYASSWTFSEDGRTITLALRTDMVWEDGQPLTADDLAYTFQLLADPAVAGTRASGLERLEPDARPKILSPGSVAFTFKEPFDRAAMLGTLAVPVVPKARLAGVAAGREALAAHALNRGAPLSSGPFKLKSHEEGKELVLVPNPAFVGPKEMTPKLREVVLKVIPAYEDRIKALFAGEVDLVDQVTVADADRIAADHPDIALHRRGWRAVEYVAWNERTPEGAPHALFADAAVRTALTRAIDVEGMIHALLVSEATGEVYGRPAVSTITPALCNVHNEAIVRIPYDASAARTSLAALGWADTNADGWLDRGGVPFRFTLLTNDGNPRRAAAAERVAKDLAQVGIEVKVELLANEVFLERLRAGQFDAALTGLSAGLTVDPAPVWSPGGEFNFVHYENAEVQALIARGLAETDADRARPVWKELQEKVYADQPVTFLWWQDELVALATRFRNPVIDIVAPYRHLWEWSVPIDRVKYRDDLPTR